MRVTEKPLLPTFNQTITVVNKLAAADSSTRRDIWYVNVLDNCVFTNKTVESVQGTVASVGNVFLARIPYSDYYLKYKDWINNIDNSYTLNPGDYVFLGELEADEEIVTANTILNIYNKHKGYAFVVRSFQDNTKLIAQLPHYRIEGV